MIQLSLFREIGGLFRSKVRSSSTATPKPLQTRKKRTRALDDPLLKGIWLDLRREWFPERADLDEYTVCWSKRRQKRTLASCNIETKKVNVASELNYDHLLHWLDPLLYHEMCHAYLGKSVYSQHSRSAWHGKEFKALERRHPQMADFDLWLKSGGWTKAVRSDRAKRAWRRRALA